MTGYHTGWACPPEQPSGSPSAGSLPSARPSVTSLAPWASASPTWPGTRTRQPTRSRASNKAAPGPPLPCSGAQRA